MPIYYQLANISLPITLESIGNHWQQEVIHRGQGYPFYHWLQTEEGRGEIWIEGKKFILNEGEGLLLAPFIPHAYYPSGKWLTNFATFEGQLSDQFSAIIGTKKYYFSKNSKDFSFSKWIDAVIQQHMKQQISPTELTVGCYNFLLQIAQQQTAQDSEEHHLKDRYVQPVIQDIETNYAKGLTVDGLAKESFISPQYLSRLFKRFMGKSPYQYLTDFRISKAKELLVNHPSLEIQEIALRVGFQSASQFIYVFHTKTGYTPKNFRGLHYKKENGTFIRKNE